MRFSLVFVLFSILLFSSDSGADDESFKISVISGDTALYLNNTDNRELPWVISNVPYSELVESGVANVRVSDLSKSSTFVFNLQGTNVHNDTSYKFGYYIRSYNTLFSSKYSKNMNPIEVIFSGNNSEEINYNLTGDFSQYNSGDNCTKLKVTVYLEELTYLGNEISFTSNAFFLEGYSTEECPHYNSYRNENYALHGFTLGLLSLLVFSHYSAKRMNTNGLIVLFLLIITFFIFPLNVFAILICWAFGVNFGGGERDQEKYERSGETLPVLITIGSFVSVFIGLSLILMSFVYNW